MNSNAVLEIVWMICQNSFLFSCFFFCLFKLYFGFYSCIGCTWCDREKIYQNKKKTSEYFRFGFEILCAWYAQKSVNINFLNVLFHTIMVCVCVCLHFSLNNVLYFIQFNQLIVNPKCIVLLHVYYGLISLIADIYDETENTISVIRCSLFSILLLICCVPSFLLISLYCEFYFFYLVLMKWLWSGFRAKIRVFFQYSLLYESIFSLE